MTSRVVFSTWGPAFGHDLRAAVPDVRGNGFGGMQLDAGSRILDLADLSSSARREIRHLFSTAGLQISSIRLDYGAGGLGVGADVDRLLDRTDAILNAAADLGVSVVCIDLGRLPPVQRAAKPRPKVTQDMAGLIILPTTTQVDEPEPEPDPVTTRINPAIASHWQGALAQLGEIADRYGTILALSSSLSSFASLSGLLGQVNCPWFGVDLDPSMLTKDEWTLDETFDAVGPLVRHVRARDAIKGEDRRTKPAVIGRGDVPWRDVLANLDGAGFTGAITIDPSELQEPRTSAIAGLKQLNAILQT